MKLTHEDIQKLTADERFALMSALAAPSMSEALRIVTDECAALRRQLDQRIGDVDALATKIDNLERELARSNRHLEELKTRKYTGNGRIVAVDLSIGHGIRPSIKLTVDGGAEITDDNCLLTPYIFGSKKAG